DPTPSFFVSPGAIDAEHESDEWQAVIWQHLLRQIVPQAREAARVTDIAKPERGQMRLELAVGIAETRGKAEDDNHAHDFTEAGRAGGAFLSVVQCGAARPAG